MAAWGEEAAARRAEREAVAFCGAAAAVVTAALAEAEAAAGMVAAYP